MQPDQQQRIMGYFIEEAKDHLNTIEQGLLNLQSTIEDQEMVNEVFRAAHSIKGGAAMLGIHSIQRTAHSLEDHFKVLKEIPIRVDQKLETLFLQVLDALQKLLEQLQGPFGLTDDIANQTMSGVEPVFAELDRHLQDLVAQAGVGAQPQAVPVSTLAEARVASQSVSRSTQTEPDSALVLIFQRDVPVRLREMLQLFKQPETQPGCREQLQELCRSLANVGDQFNLAEWTALLTMAQQAIANPDNTNRTLAPIIIKDIKQAQELVLVGRANEILPCDQLRELLPLIELTTVPEEADLGDLFSTSEELTDTLQVDPFLSDLSTESAAQPIGESIFDSWNEEVSAGDSGFPNGLAAESLFEQTDQSGPEVGMAELNSLADLFEGEVPDLGSTWQEEEIVGSDASTVIQSGANELSGFDDSDNDFADLLFEETTPSQVSKAAADDLTDLFGDALLEEDTSPISAETDAAQLFGADSLTAADHSAEFPDFNFEEPSGSGESEIEDFFQSAEFSPAEQPAIGLEDSADLGNLGQLFDGLDEPDAAFPPDTSTTDSLADSLAATDTDALELFGVAEPGLDAAPISDPWGSDPSELQLEPDSGLNDESFDFALTDSVDTPAVSSSDENEADEFGGLFSDTSIEPEPLTELLSDSEPDYRSLFDTPDAPVDLSENSLEELGGESDLGIEELVDSSAIDSEIDSWLHATETPSTSEELLPSELLDDSLLLEELTDSDPDPVASIEAPANITPESETPLALPDPWNEADLQLGEGASEYEAALNSLDESLFEPDVNSATAEMAEAFDSPFGADTDTENLLESPFDFEAAGGSEVDSLFESTESDVDSGLSDVDLSDLSNITELDESLVLGSNELESLAALDLSSEELSGVSEPQPSNALDALEFSDLSSGLSEETSDLFPSDLTFVQDQSAFSETDLELSGADLFALDQTSTAESTDASASESDFDLTFSETISELDAPAGDDLFAVDDRLAEPENIAEVMASDSEFTLPETTDRSDDSLNDFLAPDALELELTDEFTNEFTGELAGDGDLDLSFSAQTIEPENDLGNGDLDLSFSDLSFSAQTIEPENDLGDLFAEDISAVGSSSDLEATSGAEFDAASLFASESSESDIEELELSTEDSILSDDLFGVDSTSNDLFGSASTEVPADASDELADLLGIEASPSAELETSELLFEESDNTLDFLTDDVSGASTELSNLDALLDSDADSDAIAETSNGLFAETDSLDFLSNGVPESGTESSLDEFLSVDATQTSDVTETTDLDALLGIESDLASGTSERSTSPEDTFGFDLETLAEDSDISSELGSDLGDDLFSLEATDDAEILEFGELSLNSDESTDSSFLNGLGLEQPDLSNLSAGDRTSEPSTTSSDFDDLEALLDGSTDSAPAIDFSGVGDAQTASSQTFGNLEDFADLEALLESDVPAVAASPASSAPVESTSTQRTDRVTDSEFDDLDKLLEDANEKLGGSPAVKSVRGPSPRVMTRKPRPGGMEQLMRVPVKHLDNLSNLVGELVVNRNSLEQDQERLRQSLDNLLYQVQQLSDVGQRMQDLYERSLLESSLLASRQGYRNPLQSVSRDVGTDAQSNASVDVEYDPLEMDRFTGFHSLSQEMIELIVRVRESASDIEFIVDETDQVTRMFRQVTTQLQEGLTRSRMVPFAQMADRLPRAVRDNALKYKKQAALRVEGRETLIDKMILDQLTAPGGPLDHLINNAIAHGIELPDVRQAAGKPAAGQITVSAFHQGNQTVISVSDDGAGVDVERVKAKAIEKGLITSNEARTMSRLDVYELLFHPGFTTKDQADELSGRGVGMDVVLSNLSQIRGTISTDSTLGRGTSFTIRLPLTLSISKALCCISDRARIAFPMDGVEDMLDIPKDRIQTNAEGQPCISWRDTMLPLRPLNELLTYNRHLSRGNVYGGNQEEDMVSVVVLRSAGNFLALQVDQVLGEQEIVIKQLEGPVPKPVGVAGATVLGDGRIMPIADVLELIDLSVGRIRRDVGTGSLWEQSGGQAVQEPPVTKSEPMVLIVDDSITVRELLSMTFNKVGYRVEQARDGQEAWEKLRSGLPCDIVFCDIEMPRMDGLELLSRIQKDPNLSHLPIAMLTSRGADRHRQMAASLGASGYFTKPYLEEALLDAAQRMLKGEVLISSAG